MYSFLFLIYFSSAFDSCCKKDQGFPQEVGEVHGYEGVSVAQRKTTLEQHHLLTSWLLVTCHWHSCATIMSGILPHLACLGQKQKVEITWWTPKSIL